MTDNAGTCNCLPEIGQNRQLFARDLAVLDGSGADSFRFDADRDGEPTVCHPHRMPRSASPVVAPGWRIAVARGPLERARGLLGRRGLPARHGLWLGTRSVHTVGMRFTLDLVWLDRGGAVVRVDTQVGPRRMRVCLRARGVVELAAGEGPALAAALAVAATPSRLGTSSRS